jgi:hypothetical protein
MWDVSLLAKRTLRQSAPTLQLDSPETLLAFAERLTTFQTPKRRRLDEVTVQGVAFSSSCALRKEGSEHEIEVSMDAENLVIKSLRCQGHAPVTVNAPLRSLATSASSGIEQCENVNPEIVCESFFDEVYNFGTEQLFTATSLFAPDQEFCTLNGLN